MYILLYNYIYLYIYIYIYVYTYHLYILIYTFGKQLTISAIRVGARLLKGELEMQHALATTWAPTFTQVKSINKDLAEVMQNGSLPSLTSRTLPRSHRSSLAIIFDKFGTPLLVLMVSLIAPGFEQV